MVIDTSALVAILFLEPEAEDFTRAILRAEVRLMSAANFLQAAILVDSRHGPEAGKDFDEFVARIDLEIEPVTAEQARAAREAYRTHGRGHHPAGLNFGDCFAYALAKATGQPLLFKGDGFAQTDLPRAL